MGFKIPKVKAPTPKPKGKSKGKGGEEEYEPGESAPAGTNSDGYEEWLGRNTGSYYTNSSNPNATVFPPIPLEWNISPTSLDYAQCPSVQGTVGWFVASDLISAGISCFWAVFTVIAFGKYKKYWHKRRLWVSWLIGFILEALGNLINAGIVVTTKGYGELNIGHIFLVYASRPRIKIWLFAIFRAMRGDEGYRMMGSYFNLAVVEVILHIMSAAFVGVTWNRFPNESSKEYMSSVTTYMQVAPGILALTILLAAPIWLHWADPRWVPCKICDFIIVFIFFGSVYAAPWAYWAMFLQLPGPLYVLPPCSCWDQKLTCVDGVHQRSLVKQLFGSSSLH
ncbi:hypothetical protein ACHAPT_008367 [Fusarium lateritium]